MIQKQNERRRATAPALFLCALLGASLYAFGAVADRPPAGAAERPPAATGGDIGISRFATPRGAEMDHFVAALDGDLFIGVAVSAGDDAAEGARRLVVYLCDGKSVSQWMSGTIEGEKATLRGADGNVEVAIGDGEATGTVRMAGGEPLPFAAPLATGDAGLYRAEWSLADARYRASWIVLSDGRQRGGLDGKGNDILVMMP